MNMGSAEIRNNIVRLEIGPESLDIAGALDATVMLMRIPEGNQSENYDISDPGFSSAELGCITTITDSFFDIAETSGHADISGMGAFLFFRATVMKRNGYPTDDILADLRQAADFYLATINDKPLL